MIKRVSKGWACRVIQHAPGYPSLLLFKLGADMTGPFESLEDAKRIAKEVLGGADPHLGCGLVSEISKKLGSPSGLAMFELLAREQSGHEHVGITRSALLPEILDAFRVLSPPNA